jgi:hypothetical protein
MYMMPVAVLTKIKYAGTSAQGALKHRDHPYLVISILSVTLQAGYGYDGIFIVENLFRQ